MIRTYLAGALLAAVALSAAPAAAQTCPHRFQHCDPYAPNLPAPPPKRHLKGCAVNPSNPNECVPVTRSESEDEDDIS